MRRILVDRARKKQSLKRGGDRVREPLDEANVMAPEVGENLVALDEALRGLAAQDAEAAELVKLRFFAGLTSQQELPIFLSERLPPGLWLGNSLSQDAESSIWSAGISIG
jgi:ECF sigma factor